MKKIITEFIKFPFYSKLVIAFLVIGGLLGVLNMKKSFFPERAERFLNITVAYPGASPKEMEEGITLKVEEAIKGIVGIKEVTSTSSENYTVVTIEVTGDYDIDETLLEVKNAVDSIASFPVDAEKPVVSKQRSTTWAMNLGLSGDVDLMTLKKYADEIEDDLLTSGIVTQVAISGYPDLEISVEISETDLLRHNLTFQQIASAIAVNNLDISAGEIKSTKEEILIRTRARSVNPNEVGNIILKGKEDGGFLRIRDVAVVQTKFKDVALHTKMNGKEAVYFRISKLPEEDLGEISDYMKNYVDEFNAKKNGVQLYITYDFLKLLNSRLELLYQNGTFGLLLVVLTLGLFLSFRLSFWVAWGIPASFLATFIVASNAGITINMVSLFGMILVVGILVDDGIVIAENIFTHFENGKSPKRAAIDGTMEVIPAVFTSVTTTIVAFSPLFLLKGAMEFMYEMAFVVVFSLFFSLIEAFFVLPAHIGNEHILRVRKKAENIKKAKNKFSYVFHLIRAKITQWIDYLRFNIYSSVIKRVIEWRWF
ncbi:MAG: efflux RND transporter permease subunit, partial [Acidobacteria bacterium]|nr:efflux RND transporter permease subunit [Acidobacteriota bacterium]